MGRLQALRIGEPLRVREQTVGYSFWPARKTTRWKLQRRLYVRDPRAILNEAYTGPKGLQLRIATRRSPLSNKQKSISTEGCREDVWTQV
jgi:hypothetical protein